MKLSQSRKKMRKKILRRSSKKTIEGRKASFPRKKKIPLELKLIQLISKMILKMIKLKQLWMLLYILLILKQLKRLLMIILMHQ